MITHCAAENCLFLFFIHLKLELLAQFPASNDEKYGFFRKLYTLKKKTMMNYQNNFNILNDILIGLSRKYEGPAARQELSK